MGKAGYKLAEKMPSESEYSANNNSKDFRFLLLLFSIDKLLLLTVN